MSSRHLVDPELLPGLDLYPAITLNQDALPILRDLVPALRGAVTPDPAAMNDGPGIKVVRHVAAGPPGAPDISLIVFSPHSAKLERPCLYFVHGGGFISGSAAMAAEVCRALAVELDCVVIAVEYRLAPETQYPGAVNDCYAGLAWVHSNAVALGIDSARVIAANIRSPFNAC